MKTGFLNRLIDSATAITWSCCGSRDLKGAGKLATIGFVLLSACGCLERESDVAELPAVSSPQQACASRAEVLAIITPLVDPAKVETLIDECVARLRRGQIELLSRPLIGCVETAVVRIARNLSVRNGK